MSFPGSRTWTAGLLLSSLLGLPLLNQGCSSAGGAAAGVHATAAAPLPNGTLTGAATGNPPAPPAAASNTGTASTSPAAPAAGKPAASAPAAAGSERPNAFARSAVDAVLRQGPPWILRRVRVEEVLRDNAFIGWRLLELPKDWPALELKAGDIVTRVNGKTLERPDDLFSAWAGLTSAKELRVTYQRGTSKKELMWAIEGTPTGAAPAVLQEDAAPPAKAAPLSPPKKTVVIVGDDTDNEDD